MENINSGLIITLLFLLLFVAAMALIIGYFWASSKTKNALLKQNDAIYKHAQEQLQYWKEQELNIIKQQTIEAAKGQAIQEMQEQVQNWQKNELQQAKQNMFDAAKGQVTQEMQEQMRKWREGELQQIKQQIYDAIKGQTSQEMAVNIQQWQQNELQSIKKQMSDAIRGETIQEAQEQFVKWKSEELENLKRQTWDLLSKEALNNFNQWKANAEKEIRQDAIERSQSVTMGKMTEHIVPYLPGFKFNPADARFIGSPIDLIVFDGLGNGDVRKIVFVEIKTGASNLSTRERDVRSAIQDKEIEWLEIKVDIKNPNIIDEVKSRKKS